MNRADRKRLAKMNAKRPKKLTLVDPAFWPADAGYQDNRKEVWVSNKYLVQVFIEDNDIIRVSINRTTKNSEGEWEDNLTWDEIQQIKTDIGAADLYAIEVYPRGRDVVNIANMRHIWLLPEPLNIGWFK